MTDAAAIEAGFRPKTWTAPEDPAKLASTLRKHYNADEIRRIAAALLAEDT